MVRWILPWLFSQSRSAPLPAQGHDSTSTTGPEVSVGSWSFLRGSVSDVARNIEGVLHVQSDVALLQKDLATQERLWKQAESDLLQRIDSETTGLAKLRRDAASLSHVKADVQGLQERLRILNESISTGHQNFLLWQTEAKLEEKHLDERLQHLTSYLKSQRLNAARRSAETLTIEAAAKKKKQKAERNAMALEEAFADAQKFMVFCNTTSVAKEIELRSELTALRAMAKRKQDQLLPAGVAEKQKHDLALQLEQETNAILHVQTDFVEVQGACQEKLSTLGAVLRDERQKTDAQQKAVLPVCNMAAEQRNILRSRLRSSCQAPI